jgi:hypothetical protein
VLCLTGHTTAGAEQGYGDEEVPSHDLGKACCLGTLGEVGLDAVVDHTR